MAHRSFSSSRALVLTLLAAGAIAVTACSGNVSGGGGKGDTGNGAGDTGDTGGSGAGGGTAPDACTATQAGDERPCALPGDPADAPSGGQNCEMDNGGQWAWNTCQPLGSTTSTPLVLSFDGAPVTFASTPGAFDLASTMSVVTDWPTARTPWLALDRNGNGAIDDGGELFGSATVLRSGARAANGFIALAELDSNGDGRITPEDAAWPSLRLWSDADGDRVSSAGELSPLAGRRILSIDLAYTSDRRCDARGNCEVERASFRWADDAGVEHTGAIVDVHLRHQPAL
jgi:hypothetical protein